VRVPEHSYGFRLVTRVRDEAHRFAVSYHRKLRRKHSLESPLLEVPGVGPKTASRLMAHFGGLNKIGSAAVEDLVAVPGVSPRLAAAILDRFGPEDGSTGL
jgi:excinuclease ABC subunit C